MKEEQGNFKNNKTFSKPVNGGKRMKVVGCNNLYLRPEPKRKSDNIGQISKGEIVIVLDTINDEWMKVITNEKVEAFVMSNFLMEV